MKKGYLYIENGKVVWNANRKPVSVGQVNSYENIWEFLKAQKDVMDWDESCTEPDNWYYDMRPDYAECYTVGIGLNYIMVYNGMSATIDRKTIVKLG